MTITPKIGDILVASWGYDATWKDFYEVVKVTKTQVHLLQLRTERSVAPGETSALVSVKPILGSYVNDETIVRKFKNYSVEDGIYYVKIKDYALALSGQYTDEFTVFLESMYA